MGKNTTGRHGPIEPVAFLLAWRDLEVADDEDSLPHGKLNPNRGEIDKWLSDQGPAYCAENGIDLVE